MSASGKAMIDLHTHLLPDWDDGAKTWEEAFEMCEVARQDGIAKIALTPHIFRMSKHDDDLAVLKQRMKQFKERMASLPIQFVTGAEVLVHHEMVDSIKRYDLCLNHSNYVFIEFPSNYVLPGAKDLLYHLMLDGLIPIISHPERNVVFAEHPDLLCELIKMGCLGQVTAKSISGEFGHNIKKTAELLLKHNLVHVIASDAHDPEHRAPILSRGVEEAGKIVGQEKAKAMVRDIPEAILENNEIPDWGEPENPVKEKKRWAIRLPKIIK